MTLIRILACGLTVLSKTPDMRQGVLQGVYDKDAKRKHNGETE